MELILCLNPFRLTGSNGVLVIDGRRSPDYDELQPSTSVRSSVGESRLRDYHHISSGAMGEEITAFVYSESTI
jgi:hypothetical protein